MIDLRRWSLPIGIVLGFMVVLGLNELFWSHDSNPPTIVKPTKDTAFEIVEFNREEQRCICEWTDINFKSHCGHNVRFLYRHVDSLKMPIADVYHCLTDSVRIMIPIPRHFYAEATPATK